MSSEINAALHHLTDPLRRVEYILRREGLGTQETDSITDMIFLSEVLEMREELENAESQEAVDSLRAENNGSVAIIIFMDTFGLNLHHFHYSQIARNNRRDRDISWSERLVGRADGCCQTEVFAGD